MILTTPINGNANQVFLNQQNALGFHADKTRGVLYVSMCAKVVVRVMENSCYGKCRSCYGKWTPLLKFPLEMLQ